MRSFITIDNSQFPIAVARYQSFIPTIDEFLQMQADLATFFETHKDFVAIIDLTHMSFLPSELRIKQAKWSSQIDPILKKNNIRLAFTTPSLIAQMMLKGVFLISKPAVPHTVTSTIENATKWAKDQLAKN